MTTEREKVLLRREAGDLMLQYVTTYDAAARKQFVADVFPLPTREVPTVLQADGSGQTGLWYRILMTEPSAPLRWIGRYRSRVDAAENVQLDGDAWFPEDQPTVAALLALPLTEEVEDTGEDRAR